LDGRQTCAQLLRLLLAKERGRGYPSLTSTALNDLYHENTEFDVRGRAALLFQELLEDVQAVVKQRPPGSGRKSIRKSRIFSLFLFIRLLHFSPVSIKHILHDVAHLFWSGPDEESEPIGRVASSGTLEKHFAWFAESRMSDLRAPQLDRERLFSSAQKVEIWSGADGICGICGDSLTRGLEEYDHIRPWILGGRTVVENGRPVHVHCHARGIAALEGRDTPLTAEMP
jgi:5-methylcytosine-specific restriction endonuclease McrA